MSARPRTSPGPWSSTLREAALLAAIAVVMLLDAQYGRYGEGISAIGVVAVALTVAPLWWRQRAPLCVLGAILPPILLCLLTLNPSDTVVLPGMVALYAVALHGDRRRSVIVAGLILPFVAFAVLITSPHAIVSRDTVTNGALVLLALAVGDTVRSRAAAQAAHDERLRRLEAEREHDAERRVAQERLRIAREVHDVVAHAMVAINVQAGVAAHVLDQRPEQARTALTEIKRVSGAALTDLRATLGVLREDGSGAPTRPTESLAQLGELAAPLRAAGVVVAVDVAGDEGAVPAPVGAAAYRIVQEALTNVLRHAGARHADVHVRIAGDRVEVDVRDDGAAVPAIGGPLPTGSGNGLRGIAERVDAVGGSLHTGHEDGGGWRVHAVLPIV